MASNEGMKWAGAFSPGLTKTIASVSFVPLDEMTPEDWRILEYEALRETAQNRIAEAIVSGELEGFFHVNVTEKAKGKAKPHYYWPATRKAVERFKETNSADFFRYEADTENTTRAVEKVDDIINNVSVWTMTRRLLAVKRLADEASEKEIKDAVLKLGNDDLQSPDFPLKLAIWVFKVLHTDDDRENFVDGIMIEDLTPPKAAARVVTTRSTNKS